jgi:hypothetical protein
MPCLPSKDSKPDVVNYYYYRGYIQQPHDRLRTEQDEQHARAVSLEERQEFIQQDEDLQLALALSASMIDGHDTMNANEKQALSLAEALSLSEVLSSKESETVVIMPLPETVLVTKHDNTDIKDDEFKDIGDVSNESEINHRQIV